MVERRPKQEVSPDPFSIVTEFFSYFPKDVEHLLDYDYPLRRVVSTTCCYDVGKLGVRMQYLSGEFSCNQDCAVPKSLYNTASQPFCPLGCMCNSRQTRDPHGISKDFCAFGLFKNVAPKHILCHLYNQFSPLSSSFPLVYKIFNGTQWGKKKKKNTSFATSSSSLYPTHFTATFNTKCLELFVYRHQLSLLPHVTLLLQKC